MKIVDLPWSVTIFLSLAFEVLVIAAFAFTLARNLHVIDPPQQYCHYMVANRQWKFCKRRMENEETLRAARKSRARVIIAGQARGRRGDRGSQALHRGLRRERRAFPLFLFGRSRPGGRGGGGEGLRRQRPRPRADAEHAVIQFAVIRAGHVRIETGLLRSRGWGGLSAGRRLSEHAVVQLAVIRAVNIRVGSSRRRSQSQKARDR